MFKELNSFYVLMFTFSQYYLNVFPNFLHQTGLMRINIAYFIQAEKPLMFQSKNIKKCF